MTDTECKDRLIYQLRFEANSNLNMALNREHLVREFVSIVENEGGALPPDRCLELLRKVAKKAREQLSPSAGIYQSDTTSKDSENKAWDDAREAMLIAHKRRKGANP